MPTPITNVRLLIESSRVGWSARRLYRARSRRVTAPMAETPEESLPEKTAEAESTEPENRLLRAAKLAREWLPGDSELGDPLSTAGDNPSHLLARRMAESRPASERVGVARELGL